MATLTGRTILVVEGRAAGGARHRRRLQKRRGASLIAKDCGRHRVRLANLGRAEKAGLTAIGHICPPRAPPRLINAYRPDPLPFPRSRRGGRPKGRLGPEFCRLA